MPILPLPEEPDEQQEPQTQTEPARSGGDEPPRRKTAVGYGDDSNQLDPDEWREFVSLSNAGSHEIRRLLELVSTQPGAQGSLIVGDDGVLIAHNLPKRFDADTIGFLARAIFMSTLKSSKSIGHKQLHQLVCRTQNGYVVITDFGGGILVTLSDLPQTDRLIPVMRAVTQLVAAP